MRHKQIRPQAPGPSQAGRLTPPRSGRLWTRTAVATAAVFATAAVVVAVRPALAADIPNLTSGQRYEAETAPAVCQGTIDSDHAGFTGSGFCNGSSAVGAYAQFTVNASAAGTATLGVRFADGASGARPANLIVNGTTVATVSFESTGAWTTWFTKTLTATLNAGSNTIRLDPTTAAGLANIDSLDVDAATSPTPTSTPTTGTTYYVSTSGFDSNPGTSPSSPWASLSKVNATTFQPGDHILFHAGDSWTGQLWPKGSGTPGAPITIGNYGSGAKPSFAGAGKVPDAVRLWNQQYWTITGIDASNYGGSSTSDLKDLRAIHIGGDNSQTLSGFTINGVSVHDVTGVDNWIGGSTSGNQPGINFNMGWDRAKNTGGIVFNTTVPNIAAPPSKPTILNDILIENSSVRNTSWGGIVIKQYSGDAPGAKAAGWGVRATATDPRFSPFTNVTIQGNYITQVGAAYGTNGIFIDAVRQGLVQNNLVDRVGTSGIEFDYSDQVVAQYNEVTGTTKKGGGDDSNGMDTDMGVTNIVFQYNYLHNNGMGYLACACNSNLSFGNATFRYNVVANNSNPQIRLANVNGSSTAVYNNTVYNTAASIVDGYGPTTMTNNIFYTTRAKASMTTSGVTYHNNLYGGTNPTIPSGESHAITGDPQFANPTAGGTGTPETGPDLKAGLNWLIAASSPAVRAGVAIANNGGIDYNGVQVPTVPDIGAFQHKPTGASGLQ